MTKKPMHGFVVPKWAKVFDEEPLELNEKTDGKAFVASLERRLDALLQLHGCSPTPDGWRSLALKLALGFSLKGKNLKNKNPLKVITPKTRERKGSGRPKGPMSDFWIKEIDWQLRHNSKNGAMMTDKEAAECVKKKYNQTNIRLKRSSEEQYNIPDVERLRNIYSESKNSPDKHVSWQSIINLSLQEAALRLEKKSRK